VDAIHQLDAIPRRVVATYDDYEDAQAHVNRLSHLGFAVDHVIIVGTEPVLVERVTGRLDAWRAAMSGLLSGAIIGLLFGWIWALWFAHDGTSLLAILLYWLGAGALFGALMGVLGYAFSSRRAFTSEATITARHYAVMVDEPLADEAQRLMNRVKQTPVTN
jgi:hypothetical protein